MANEQIVIPYGNPAGERAYEIMKRIAERLWEQAQDTTAAFVDENFPNAKTAREWIENETYFREIKSNRRTRIISYDLREKTVALTETREELKNAANRDNERNVAGGLEMLALRATS